jgi:CRISPR/Cas system-associated exonuclease Cas4 (RecB family)
MSYKFPEKIYPNTINTYLQCPFKFKCHCDRDVKAEFVESSESFVGKAIHLALKDFFDVSKVPMEKRKNQDAGKMLRTAWARVPKNEWLNELWSAEERANLFGSKDQEKVFGLQAIIMLKNYISSADLSAVPCSLGEFKIAGRIDRIDQDSESAVSVWDYKTGKLPFHDTLEKRMEEDLQVPMYAVIASKLNPFADKIRVGLIYIKYSKIYETTWTKEQLKELEDKILTAIRKAKSDTEMAPHINKLCAWCEYMKVCPVKDSISARAEPKVDEVNW